MLKNCKIKGCEEPHYAKGYCRNHYETNRRNGNPIPRKKWLNKICRVNGCNNKIYLLGLCSKHYRRFKKYGSFEDRNNKGENNPRWNGGVSQYPNHYLMKKNRLLKLKQSKGKCEICNGEGKYIHHIDGSKTNHNLSNLIVVCAKCHGLLHTGRTNKSESISKFKRLYGMSIKEMVEKYGRSYTIYYSWHQKGYLKEYLDNPQIIFNTQPKKRLSKFQRLYGMTLKEISKRIGRNGINIALNMHYKGTLKEYLNSK